MISAISTLYVRIAFKHNRDMVSLMLAINVRTAESIALSESRIASSCIPWLVSGMWGGEIDA